MEIVAVFRAFLFLVFEYPRVDSRSLFVESPEPGASFAVFVDLLGNNIARSCKRFIGGSDTLVFINVLGRGRCQFPGRLDALRSNQIGQWRQPLVSRDGGTGTPLGSERKVDILESGQRSCGGDCHLELVGQ